MRSKQQSLLSGDVHSAETSFLINELRYHTCDLKTIRIRCEELWPGRFLQTVVPTLRHAQEAAWRPGARTRWELPAFILQLNRTAIAKVDGH